MFFCPLAWFANFVPIRLQKPQGPNIKMLQCFLDLPRGTGDQDIVDVITVAVDMVASKLQDWIPKTVTIISKLMFQVGAGMA